jgi:protease secretion system membrane fusion protein
MRPNADYRSAVRAGVGILVVGFGGFLAWAALAPLDEAVPAPGVVAVESKRKRVEHLAGGQIREILVREGQLVRAGQELVVLDEAQSKAGLNAALSQWRVAAATELRLKAERDGLKTVAFPKELASEGRAQTEVFRARRAALEGELHILREAVRGLEGQLKSLEELESGRAKQVKLFQEQLGSFRNLREQGFVSRNQILELERQLAEVQSRESETLAGIAGVNAKLTELRMRAAQREVEYRREVESQLAEVQKELGTLGERVAAQKDVNSRLVIRAPVAGVVVDLAFHTVGGVVRPGDRILDLVPADDDLIVEARVAPQYIDRVRAGLTADVHFDAYLARAEQPVVRGAVTLVSADALADPRSGVAHYSVRVTVPRAELERLGRLQLVPGMQATVMVKTGERTLLAYLGRPLLRRFAAALTES